MKIKCYVVFVVLILFSLQTTGQEKGSQLFTVKVGRQSIVIPSPENDLAEVGDTIRKEYELLVPKDMILKAVFLPNDDIQKFRTNKAISSVKLIILIEADRVTENIDCAEQDFVAFKDTAKSKYPNDLLVPYKDANQVASKLKDVIAKKEFGTTVILGTALDVKDAYAYYVFNSDDIGKVKVLTGALFIRLKNKVVCFYIDNYKVNEESLAWMSNTIQTWSKSLFELNKDLVPITNSSANNSVQDTISSNNSGQNAKNSDTSSSLNNMFNAIGTTFSELLTKNPITFIVLCIIIILYYYGTRRLLKTYLNSKTNQSSIYLYIKHIHYDKSGKNDLVKNFFRLFEFGIVLFIILAILRYIGFSVPSGII